MGLPFSNTDPEQIGSCLGYFLKLTSQCSLELQWDHSREVYNLEGWDGLEAERQTDEI
jgi:hypothetical protein